MPYIKKELRFLFDGYIELILSNIYRYSTGDSNSMMAYIIYKLIKEEYNKESWEIMSDALKVLDDVGKEFYRKIMTPYADKKIQENGDI